MDCIGQSVANIAPTLTPALNIAVVAGLAGSGSWLGFLVATIGILFVAFNIATLSRRHTLSGSYFIYIGRTVGPLAGRIAGWLMIGAYLATAIAISVSEVFFLENFLASLGLKAFMPNAYAAAIAAYRDVRLSARFGLVLEVASILILIAITAVVVFQRGIVIDSRQLDFTSFGYGGIMTSLTFAVFSFVGFESSATLARETRNPARNVPLAVTLSAMLSGLFFVAITYFMVLGIGDDTRALGDSSASFIVMTERASLSAAGTAMNFGALISGLACLLASINAASRLMFSMARYGYLATALTMVHRRHRTPSAAVIVTVAATLVGSLATLPLGALGAFGFAVTLATFGFLAASIRCRRGRRACCPIFSWPIWPRDPPGSSCSRGAARSCCAPSARTWSHERHDGQEEDSPGSRHRPLAGRPGLSGRDSPGRNALRSSRDRPHPCPVADKSTRLTALEVKRLGLATVDVLTRRDAKSATTYVLRRIDCVAREFQYLGEGTTEQQAREGRAADTRKKSPDRRLDLFYVAAYACPGWKAA